MLRSKFPFRKRRKGKQGQQLYVYRDVALKSEQEEVNERGVAAQISKAYSPGILQPGPSNNAGEWLVSSSQAAANVIFERNSDASHHQSLQSPKRYKVNLSNDLFHLLQLFVCVHIILDEMFFLSLVFTKVNFHFSIG